MMSYLVSLFTFFGRFSIVFCSSILNLVLKEDNFFKASIKDYSVSQNSGLKKKWETNFVLNINCFIGHYRVTGLFIPNLHIIFYKSVMFFLFLDKVYFLISLWLVLKLWKWPACYIMYFSLNFVTIGILFVVF